MEHNKNSTMKQLTKKEIEEIKAIKDKQIKGAKLIKK
jgi:hypothetical protein